MPLPNSFYDIEGGKLAIDLSLLEEDSSLHSSLDEREMLWRLTKYILKYLNGADGVSKYNKISCQKSTPIGVNETQISQTIIITAILQLPQVLAVIEDTSAPIPTVPPLPPPEPTPPPPATGPEVTPEVSLSNPQRSGFEISLGQSRGTGGQVVETFVYSAFTNAEITGGTIEMYGRANVPIGFDKPNPVALLQFQIWEGLVAIVPSDPSSLDITVLEQPPNGNVSQNSYFSGAGVWKVAIKTAVKVFRVPLSQGGAAQIEAIELAQ